MQRVQPALLGGLFIGVLSALPLVRYGNACCCLWVVTGGLLTVYLLRQQSPSFPARGTSDAFEAVLAGVLAGIFGAVIETLLALVVGSHPSPDEMQQMFDQLPQFPPEFRDRAIQIVTERGSVFLALISLFVSVPMYAIFSALGALLGLAVLKKPPQIPAPPASEA